MGCLAGSIWCRVARFGASDSHLGAQEDRMGVQFGFFGIQDCQFGVQIERLAPLTTDVAHPRSQYVAVLVPDRCELARLLRPARATWAPSNAQAGSIWLPTLALGALQRLAGSIWLLMNAPTTAPSNRLVLN